MRAAQDCGGIAKSSVGSTVVVSTPNGQGSVATFVRFFTTVEKQLGGAIQLLSDQTYGTRFLIREGGVYAFTYSGDCSAGASTQPCIVRNSVGTSAPANSAIMAITVTPANTNASCAATFWCDYGDVISAQTATGTSVNITSNIVRFTAVKVV